MGNYVDLSHMSEDLKMKDKRVTRHHFMMQDDYEYQGTQITIELDLERPVSNEMIFILADAAASGEMLMIAEEKGFLYINGQGCQLDHDLIKELRNRYARPLEQAVNDAEMV